MMRDSHTCVPNCKGRPKPVIGKVGDMLICWRIDRKWYLYARRTSSKHAIVLYTPDPCTDLPVGHEIDVGRGSHWDVEVVSERPQAG